MQIFTPEGVCHDDCIRVRFQYVLSQPHTVRYGNAQGIEVIDRDFLSSDANRLIAGLELQLIVNPIAGQRDAGLPNGMIVRFGDSIARTDPEHDQGARSFYGHRPEEDGIDQGEERSSILCRAPATSRQRPRALAETEQRSGGVREVVPEIVEPE